MKAINLPGGNQMSKPKKTFSKRIKRYKNAHRRREKAKTGRKRLTMLIQAGESDEIAIREFIDGALSRFLRSDS